MKTKTTPIKSISLLMQNISKYSLEIIYKVDFFMNFKIYKFINITSLFLLFSISIHAQDVVELNTYLNQSKSFVGRSSSDKTKHLKSLISELNPSVIIKNGIINTYSKAPFFTIDVEPNSISKLNESNSQFSEVELIIIRINKPEDLSISVETPNLTHFPKLRYIYFLCSFKCTSEQINNLIKSKNP